MLTQQQMNAPVLRCVVGVVTLFTFLGTGAALSQETGVSSGGYGVLEEVIVTATKRTEDLQAAPLAVTAISGDTFVAQGVTEFAEIASSIPGLGAVSGGLGQTTFSLRGISTGGSDFQSQAPIGYYLDDTPITLPNVYYAGQWDPGFFDLNRVEVLRGPQGSLYGAGSLAGAIRLISNQPDTSTFEARLRGSLADVEGGTPNGTADAMINVPIVNGQLGWRTVASLQSLGGYIDQTTPSGQTFPDVNSQSMGRIRTALTWTPNSAITLTPSVLYQHAVSQANPTVTGVGGAPDSFHKIGWLTEPSSDQLELASLNLHIEESWFSINSNNSYFHRLWNGKPDYSDANSEPWYATLHPAWADFAERSEAATSETRFQSNGTGPFQWLLGIYYQRQLNHQYQQIFVPGITALTGGVYGGLPLLDDSPFVGYTGYEVTQSAAFGELNYKLPFGLTFTVGGRGYDINSTLSRNLNGYFAGGPVDYSVPAHSSGFIPKYEVSYTVDDSKMVYALADKGFRIGGPNIQVPVSLCLADLEQLGLSAAPTDFKPDSLWNYELGAKTDWADHRLRVNIAAYYDRWTNIQEFTNMQCGYGFTSNIATARSEGVELETKSILSDHWAAGGTLSVNKAQYTSNLSGAGIVDGNRLEDAPETTGSAYIEFSHLMPGLPAWTLTAHGEFMYTGNMQYAYTAQDPTFQYSPSYSVINGRINLTKNSLVLSLYANNLLNRLNLNYLNSFPNNFLNLYEAGALPPRTVGFAIDKKF